MKLLCDEDVGTGVPRALKAVGYAAASLNSVGWLGKPDVWWLAQAGDNGWVVFSCNKKQLKVSTERQVITDHNVGIVYMTNGEESPALMLKVLVNRWEKLAVSQFRYVNFPPNEAGEPSAWLGSRSTSAGLDA